jgi:iron complex transport system substrate-binding protein
MPFFLVARYWSLVTFLTVLTVLLGAGGAKAVTFIDEVGRKVEVKPNPARIISLAPNLTEIFFALGLGDRVVGVSSYCNYPPEAKAKEKVGGYINPSLEKIIALKPDLVFGTADGDLKAFVDKMITMGIPVYITNPESVEGVIGTIQHIGEVTSATAAATQLSTSMHRRIRAVREKVQDRPRPRVIHILSFEPLMSSGTGSFVHDLIHLAGGENIVKGVKVRHPRISMEEVIAKDPEVILLSGMVLKDPLAEQKQWWERWKEISAVRSGRIHVLEADLIHRPSPRIVDGLEAMAKAIHPECFKK